MADLTAILDDAIRDLAEDTTPDIDADFLVTSDTSATAPKKVLPRNLLALYALLASPAFTGNPTAPTQSVGNNSTRLANTAFVTAAIAALVGTAPGILDTLGEISDAINDDANLYTTLVAAIAATVDNTAYDATSWDGDTTHAPSKNAVRDKIESLGAAIPTISDTAYDATTWNGVTTIAPSKNAVRDEVEALITSIAGMQPLNSDLTTIAGLTATTDNFLQSKSSAWASRTVAQVLADLQGTGLVTDAGGFRTIPQNSQSAAYTTVAADSGKHVLHPAADTNARTYTIDSNANVAYPVGTAITFVNETSQVVTIAITSDTLVLAGSTTTGSRSLAQNGVATALKVTSTKWIISGTGLT